MDSLCVINCVATSRMLAVAVVFIWTQSSRYREFHPIPLTEPYVTVSHHTALIVQPIQMRIQLANDKIDKDNTYESSLHIQMHASYFL